VARKKAYVNLTLTEDILQEAVKIVRQGNFRYVAAARVGVPFNTWNGWIKRGRNELKDYANGIGDEELTIKARLILELDRVEAECHAQILEDVANSDNVTAKMWFLQRRYNKLYSKNPNAHLDDETGEMVHRTASDILAEKLLQFLEQDGEDVPGDN
jgi:hypothetical protein